MAKLKLGVVPNEKPVKVAIEMPAETYRELIAYAEVYGRETGQPVPEPTKLIVPMLARFMQSDRAFRVAKRTLGLNNGPKSEVQL